MPKHYSYDSFLELSENWQITYDGTALVIDNFYKNAEEIYEHLCNRDYPMWKYDKDITTKNGVNYKDCRILDLIPFPNNLYLSQFEKIIELCRKHWWQGGYKWQPTFEINCFQTINIFDNKLQHFPHIDSELNGLDNQATLNMLVYLDKEENGGTAIYEGNLIKNNEQKNLLYPVKEKFNIKKIIKSKFNRCVIFTGNKLHGAYIEDYTKYVDKWRFTQIIFLRPNRVNSE